MAKGEKTVFLEIHPDNPQERLIQQVVATLKDGGVIIYPTDTVYAMACDIYNPKAINRVCQIRGLKPDKAFLSLICYDLSHLAEYTKQVHTPIFKLMKKLLPGPYTFILNANNNVPKTISPKRKSVGIRVPDNNIARTIVDKLGNPLLSASIKNEDALVEYHTDPYEIYQKYDGVVDIVIDGGYGQNIASTILDCSNDEIELVREGLGPIDFL